MNLKVICIKECFSLMYKKNLYIGRYYSYVRFNLERYKQIPIFNINNEYIGTFDRNNFILEYEYINSLIKEILE